MAATPAVSSTAPAAVKRARKNPQRRQSEQQARAKAAVAEVQVKQAPPISAPVRPACLARAQTSPLSTPATAAVVPSTSHTTTTAAVRASTAKPRQQGNPQQTARPKTSPSPKTASNPTTAALAPAAILTGGLLGCAASAFLLTGIGLWQDSANNDSAILAARTAQLCLNNFSTELITSLKSGTYSTDEALDVLRRTSLAYASTVPGGTGYIERIFRELAVVRRSRGGEGVGRAIQRARVALHERAEAGATADEMRLVLVKELGNLSSFTGGAVREIVDRNPELKVVRDGAVKALEGSPQQAKVQTVRLNVRMKQKIAS
ncbi:hypothetical protein LTR62_006026 [Meristemomyces frigidus]|uniref:Uncharacterized protein n=1 Tax=Meristemomyces frigidus TaxID=1508187 RepID=A0AAN7YK44_9PEZI|nr:hypothetical protein LTR62_006026 [Meristemomyces frigidus]